MNITAFRLALKKVQDNDGRASIWFNGKTVPCDKIVLLPESDIDGLIEIRRGSSKLLVDVKAILAVEASTRSE
jgi:hypothetical protein